jgi:hypothetical protein
VSDSTPKIDRFCAHCKSQISEKRVAFAWTNADARTELNGDEREPRNTAGVVTESFRAERQPSVAGRCLPSKLRPVRRAHTCLTKTAREPYPTSGRTSSRVACQSDRSPGGGHLGDNGTRNQRG